MEINRNIFNKLNLIRQSIGASKGLIDELRSKRKTFSSNPFETELIEKGDIILSDAQFEENVHYPAGLAAIGSTQVTLHIYQPVMDIETFLIDTDEEAYSSSPKFHVSECRTLIQMREKGRYNRYIATQRQKNGYTVQPTDRKSKELMINIIDEANFSKGMKLGMSYFNKKEDIGKMKLNIDVCKNCLEFLNYKDYEESNRTQRQDIFNSFNLTDFLEHFKYIFRCLPLYGESTFPGADYSKDWAKVSNELRKSSGWMCSCCNVVLESEKGLLHVHHKDGIKGNNKPSNLEVLCALCHKKKPFHEGMNIKDNEEKKIKNLRRKQSSEKKCSKCNS